RLRASRMHTTMTATDICASAATIVFLAGHRRRAQPGTRILLHEPEVGMKSGDRLTSKRYRERATQLERQTRNMAALYAERCGKRDKNWLLGEMADELPMSLSTALQCGLLHEVIGGLPDEAPRMVSPRRNVPSPQVSIAEARQRQRDLREYME